MSEFLDAHYLDVSSKPLRLKNGEDHAHEEVAAAWLAKGREGVTALSDKRDYLTKDQLDLRYQKEVLCFSDESMGSGGIYKRKYNPLAGSRPGKRVHDDK